MDTPLPFVTYYESGVKRSEGTHINGVAHGIFVDYFPNGQMHAVYEYVNGQCYGPLRYWNEDGTLMYDFIAEYSG